MKTVVLRLLIAAALLGPVYLVQRRIDAVPEAMEKPELLYLPESGVMQALACGHQGALEDVLKIQAITYLLKELRDTTNPRYLVQLFKTMTDLDPQDAESYVLGALFLSSIAQRHQASLDLLARADGRRFVIGEDGKVRALDREPEAAEPRWLDFVGRFSPRDPKGGRLHPEHPLAWRVAENRASYFLVMRQEYSLAADEYLEMARAMAWADNAEALRKRAEGTEAYAIDLKARSENSTERRQLEETLKGLDRRLKSTANEAIERETKRRIEEVETRLNEIGMEAAVAAVYKARRMRVTSVEQLKLFIKKGEIRDPIGTGYVFFPDGRVRSPGRVKREAEREARAALRAYEDAHGGQAAPSLEAAGFDPKNVDAAALVGYDPQTGGLEARFVGP